MIRAQVEALQTILQCNNGVVPRPTEDGRPVCVRLLNDVGATAAAAAELFAPGTSDAPARDRHAHEVLTAFMFAFAASRADARAVPGSHQAS